MTAYGRGRASCVHGALSVEVHTVNRRALEISVTLPRAFACLEVPVRKQIAQRIGRGMVTVLVDYRPDAHHPAAVTPNIPLARGIKQAWEQVASALSLEPRIDLSFLLHERSLLLFEEPPSDEGVQDALTAALDSALSQLVDMREREGYALSQDLYGHVCALHTLVDEMAARAPGRVDAYRAKLTERLKTLLPSAPEHEERLLREIALFADRVDIAEEVTRLRSHLDQFRHTLERPLTEECETRGRVLEFLIQELHREIHTIGSKAADLSLAQYVVQAKGILEKMREQVQNIE